MSARIIGMNHEVISFTLNGKPVHMVNERELSLHESMVNDAIQAVGSNDWAKVSNYLDALYPKTMEEGRLDKALERMCH
jgi:hypothetical protein